MFADLLPHELPLWGLVTTQFRLGRDSIHGPGHWLTVRRNGLYLATHHPADEEVVRLFAVFHDSCRENERSDPQHGLRGALLAIDFREAGHFQLDDARMDLLITACEIHNGGPPQTDPTLGVCLDADRLDLPRVGIAPDRRLLSTAAAKSLVSRGLDTVPAISPPPEPR
jgi:uncharacterized protein